MKYTIKLSFESVGIIEAYFVIKTLIKSLKDAFPFMQGNPELDFPGGFPYNKNIVNKSFLRSDNWAYDFNFDCRSWDMSDLYVYKDDMLYITQKALELHVFKDDSLSELELWSKDFPNVPEECQKIIDDYKEYLIKYDNLKKKYELNKTDELAEKLHWMSMDAYKSIGKEPHIGYFILTSAQGGQWVEYCQRSELLYKEL